MQSIIACGGLISCALLYGALFHLAIATMKKTEEWHDKIAACRTWPRDSAALSTLDIERYPTACVFPDLSRPRGTSRSESFLAKDILTQAFEVCVEEGSCER